MANIRQLSPLLQKKAINELNEDPDTIQSAIDALREWIDKQPHLNARTSDQFLVAFLRGTKFSLERAKEKIDNYYTLRAGLPEVFRNRFTDDKKVLDILRLGVTVRLPMTDGEDGSRITIIRSGAYDPNTYRFEEMIRIGSIIGDIQIIEDDNSVVSGYTQIMDLKDVSAGHFFQIDMGFMKKLNTISEKGMPIRQKGIHFINTPPGFETIFNTIKSFMSEKTKSRIHVHGNNLEALYKFIPKKLLPAEYGGENGTIADILEFWEKKFLSYKDYFLEEANYKTNEKLRIGHPVDIDQLFGIDGSFRKLNVD